MDTAHLDRALATLHAHKTEWARLPIREKVALLDRLRERTGRVAPAWVATALAAKGIDPTTQAPGEEWTSGPFAFVTFLNAIEQTLEMLDRGENPLDTARFRRHANGQVIADVFPTSFQDRLFFSGHRAETWLMPDITLSEARQGVAPFYRQTLPEGEVGLVLGAGNISSIAPLDVLDQMLSEGRTCIVKLNPVNDYLGEFFEDIFAPMIDAGWVRFVYGGADVGSYLAHHHLVDAVHITGSAKTHDAIVFGAGEEGAARKARNEPILKKPITSELGGVGPTIVVPGDWSAKDIRYQAEHIATQRFHHNGYNCVASQIVVMANDWPQRAALVAAIRQVMSELPRRAPYYPGTSERMDAVRAAYPACSAVPWGEQEALLITDVDPDQPQYGFRNEFFGPALMTTSLPGRSVPEFLANATAFANHSLYGTLAANFLIDPKTAAQNRAVLEQAIEDLEYGTITVNSWVGHAYGIPRVPWGGFPGATLDDIQSGIGFVHNALLIEHPQRTVVRAPFAAFPRVFASGQLHFEPKPPTFVTSRSAATLGERLTRQAVSNKWRDIPGILIAAMRG